MDPAFLFILIIFIVFAGPAVIVAAVLTARRTSAPKAGDAGTVSNHPGPGSNSGGGSTPAAPNPIGRS